MDEQKSFPVRYMVLRDEWGDYVVTDTFELLADVTVWDDVYATRICKLLNESEGYRYDL